MHEAIGTRHWLLALLVALSLHVVLLYQWSAADPEPMHHQQAIALVLDLSAAPPLPEPSPEPVIKPESKIIPKAEPAVRPPPTSQPRLQPRPRPVPIVETPPKPTPVVEPEPQPSVVNQPVIEATEPVSPQPSVAADSTSQPVSPPAVATPANEARQRQANASYSQILNAALSREFKYPRRARRRNISGVVVLAFSVDQQGNLANARIVKSSGHDVLDQDALKLLEKAAPFTPPPPGAKLDWALPIRYQLK